ncbi:MAG: hypothetical protein ACRC4G_01210 [Alphaproteobacteria bacterium]
MKFFKKNFCPRMFLGFMLLSNASISLSYGVSGENISSLEEKNLPSQIVHRPNVKEPSEEQIFFSNLPLEIYQRILEFLPFDALRQLRQVDKFCGKCTLSIYQCEINAETLPDFNQNSSEWKLLRGVPVYPSMVFSLSENFIKKLKKHMSSLVGLYMPGTYPIMDTPLLLDFNNLKSLGLSDNKLGVDGIQKLSVILPESQITALNLRNNGIGPVGIEALANVLPQTQIDTLVDPNPFLQGRIFIRGLLY